MLNSVILGDCFTAGLSIPDESVDMILSDMPYNKTACHWDKDQVNLDKLWELYRRVIKPNGAIVLTACQPFTSKLIMSNYKEYKHYWAWNKKLSSNFATAKFTPLSCMEDIVVFCKKGHKVSYFPLLETRGKPRKKGGYTYGETMGDSNTSQRTVSINNTYYPKNYIEISNAARGNGRHPTEKPIELFIYLINTYSKENEVVLDTFSGHSTTAIACLETNRKFICIEKDTDWYNRSLDRIHKWKTKEEKYNETSS